MPVAPKRHLHQTIVLQMQKSLYLLVILLMFGNTTGISFEPVQESVAPVNDSLSDVRVSDDGKYFVRGTSAERFIVWGVNYDHD